MARCADDYGRSMGPEELELLRSIFSTLMLLRQGRYVPGAIEEVGLVLGSIEGQLGDLLAYLRTGERAIIPNVQGRSGRAEPPLL